MTVGERLKLPASAARTVIALMMRSCNAGIMLPHASPLTTQRRLCRHVFGHARLSRSAFRFGKKRCNTSTFVALNLQRRKRPFYPAGSAKAR